MRRDSFSLIYASHRNTHIPSALEEFAASSLNTASRADRGERDRHVSRSGVTGKEYGGTDH